MSGEVQIAIYTDMTEAEIAKGLLTANGVPCMLAHDDAGSTYPQLHQSLGVRLVVPENFAEEAMALLDDAQADARSTARSDTEADPRPDAPEGAPSDRSDDKS